MSVTPVGRVNGTGPASFAVVCHRCRDLFEMQVQQVIVYTATRCGHVVWNAFAELFLHNKSDVSLQPGHAKRVDASRVACKVGSRDTH